jgi:hypothetical protein
MKFNSLLAVCLLAFTFCSSVFAEGFMQVANVSKVNGTAYFNKEKIAVGAEVTEGMEINIPKKGDYVEVKFQNGHLVRLTGAKVKVETLNPKNTLFNLLKGKIYSAIKPLTKDETFQVKTKRVSFGVRGTKFMVEESKKNSYLCVCEGIVAAKSNAGEVDVNKDEDLTIRSLKEAPKASLATKNMMNMTNQVFMDMGFTK